MKLKNIFILIFILILGSCKEPEARRPITASKSYTLASTTESLKKINQIEEQKVSNYIQRDSLSVYQSSSDGYWYNYIRKVEEESPLPKKGDLVTLSYEILDLNDQVIYSKEELGEKEYKVDKEDFIPALQLGIKKMKQGETIKFVIPSFNAFGVTGDGNRIGINQSVVSIVTLLNIKEEIE